MYNNFLAISTPEPVIRSVPPRIQSAIGCLLPVPRSSDCESFMECDRQTRWIERCIQMSVGGDMSVASAIECFRRRLGGGTAQIANRLAPR